MKSKNEDHEQRIKEIVYELELIQKRPTGVKIDEFKALKERMNSAESRMSDSEARIFGLNKDITELTKVVDGHTKHLGTLNEVLRNITNKLESKCDRKEIVKKADMR